MTQIAKWLARTENLDNRDLILWVSSQGGWIHPNLEFWIWETLRENPPQQMMQTLWHLALFGYLRQESNTPSFSDWKTIFLQEGFTPIVRQQFLRFFRLHISLRKPFRWLETEDEAPSLPTKIGDLVDWEIEIDASWVYSSLKDTPRWKEELPEILSDTTNLLRNCLDLMHELGGANETTDHSYIDQPSIKDHSQNFGTKDWTTLINLTRDAWLATAERFPDLAYSEVERWWTIRYPLFRRLVFFAATHDGLFKPKQVLNWLLSDDHWWLWSVETEHEVLQLLKNLTPRLNSGDLRTLERAILKGPPRDMVRNDIEPDRLQNAFDREIWLRLIKCEKVGVKLGSAAAKKLVAISQEHPQWQLEEDGREEFPFWMDSNPDRQALPPSPRRPRELVEWLKQYPSRDHWYIDDWEQRCSNNFRTVACVLRKLAREGKWLEFENRWKEAFQVWSHDNLPKRSWRYMGPIVDSMPDDVIKPLIYPIGWWLQEVSKSFEDHKSTFFDLVRKVLSLSIGEETKENDDLVFAALNHPTGYVTRTLQNWWHRKPLKDKQGLSTEIRGFFTELCNFQHGRVLLSVDIVTLFRVDPEWKTDSLIPFFDWQKFPMEAREVWQGLLCSSRLYPSLLTIIPFLKTSCHYDRLDRYREQYAQLLTSVALDAIDFFNKDDVSAAIHSLPQQGLEQSARAIFYNAKSRDESTRGEFWRNRVRLLIKTLWPQSKERKTHLISETFAELCTVTGDAFPEAVKELKYWLTDIQDKPFTVIFHLKETGLHKLFPEAALELLNCIVDKERGGFSDLRKCLEEIKTADPGLSTDSRFRQFEYHGLV